MFHRTAIASLAALALAISAPSAAFAEKEKAADNAPAAANPALDAKPQKPRRDYDWMKRHEAILAGKDKLNPEVVMIGDSITHMWAGFPDTGKYGNRGPVSWKKLHGDKPVLNLGFGADRVQNVLWRLQQGEMDGLKPKWVVLNIGTNNLVGGGAYDRACSPAEIDEGIQNLVGVIRSKAPSAKLVVMGVFPRGASAKDAHRAKIAELNALLKKRFAGAKDTTFLDIGEKFLEPDGTLPRELMPDRLHPSEKGYALWADALAQVMKK